jgi:hypothetical protein
LNSLALLNNQIQVYWGHKVTLALTQKMLQIYISIDRAALSYPVPTLIGLNRPEADRAVMQESIALFE